MFSTFRRGAVFDDTPRTRLLPGVTSYYHYSRRHGHRRRAAINPEPPKPPVLPAIPESAPAFAIETLKFPIDPMQQDVLSSPSNRIVVCCSRQWGKSSIGAIKALHHAATHPGSLTLLASRTERQSGGLLEKVKSFAKSLGIPLTRAPQHSNSLLLPNDACIIALPGQPDSLRGFSAVSLLIIDEAAYVPDELYYALRPTLATTNGAIWLLSTPRHRTGFFYDEWTSPGTTWSKFRVTASECPRISEEFLEEERLRHGPAIFQREYCCDFGYTGQSYFDVDSLDEAADPDRYLAAQQFTFGRPATRIIVGFDLGQRSSHSAVVVVEIVTGATGRRDPVTFQFIQETRATFRRIERFPLDVHYDSIVSRLHRIVRDLGDPQPITLVVDATGCGQPFVDILRKEKMGVLIAATSITSGGKNSFSGGIEHVSKKDLLSSANYLLMNPALSSPPGLAGLKELREEMEAFHIRTSRSGHDTFRSSAGEKDDLVMAFALAAWRIRPYLPKATAPPPPDKI